jgi:hypothetical protein
LTAYYQPKLIEVPTVHGREDNTETVAIIHEFHGNLRISIGILFNGVPTLAPGRVTPLLLPLKCQASFPVSKYLAGQR